MKPVIISPEKFKSTLYRVKLCFDFGYCFVKLIENQSWVTVVKILNIFLEIDEPNAFQVKDFEKVYLLTHDFIILNQPRSKNWEVIENTYHQDLDFLFPDLRKTPTFVPPLNFDDFAYESKLSWYLVREFDSNKSQLTEYDCVKHLGEASAWDTESLRHFLTILWQKAQGYSLDSIRTVYDDDFLEKNHFVPFMLRAAMRAPLFLKEGIDKRFWNQARC